MLDRGSRDLARRGVFVQKRQLLELATGVNVYPLPGDHTQTFTMFCGVAPYSVGLRMLSQDAHAWYLVIDSTGVLRFQDNAPASEILFTADDVYWLQMPSPDGHIWYLYPSDSGHPTVRDVQPGVGTGRTSTVRFRDEFGVPWYIYISDSGIYFTSTSGTPTVTGTALSEGALDRVEVEALTRIDPRGALASERPERYAIAGKILYVQPTPDKPYVIDHKYFADDIDLLPQPTQHLPVLFATAIGLQRVGRPVQAGQVLSMAKEWQEILAINLFPGGKDGSDMYNMSPR